ncbi:hypothetical protein MSAN_01104100 [Mycena sanguinolenta]|uniref:Uncharacterized protein n=1 Tax=Mycena sanguinolenta TaxID=230812 RepID=A0A8H6YU93_9AGAR|nr:hypothetical protein MSAN_01104100 [Mycena sanguinolenta]
MGKRIVVNFAVFRFHTHGLLPITRTLCSFFGDSALHGSGPRLDGDVASSRWQRALLADSTVRNASTAFRHQSFTTTRHTCLPCRARLHSAPSSPGLLCPLPLLPWTSFDSSASGAPPRYFPACLPPSLPHSSSPPFPTILASLPPASLPLYVSTLAFPPIHTHLSRSFFDTRPFLEAATTEVLPRLTRTLSSRISELESFGGVAPLGGLTVFVRHYCVKTR